MTNAHVIHGARRIEVSTWDGRSLEVDVAALASTTDLGFARVRGDLPEPARIADTDPDPGAAVTVVGYPGGGQLTFTEGEVIDYIEGDEVAEFGRVMRMTAAVRQGNSGGPVLDPDGNVVGVVFGFEQETDHGLAIPPSSLERVAASGDFQPVGPCR